MSAGVHVPTMICLLAALVGSGPAPSQELFAGTDPGCESSAVTSMSERVSKSELTRNFLALTVYAPAADAPFGRIPEIENFPGWSDRGERVLDADGGWIYAFDHDESGVGVSYYWLLRRARFTEPKLSPTPRQLAHSMAGVAPSSCGPDLRPTPAGIAAHGDAAPRWCSRVGRYIEEWLGLAPLYFGRPLGPDEVLDLRDPDELWNWMRVMYHHEAGRTPVVDRATFDRGIRLAADYISAGDRLERPLSDYLDPCGAQASPSSAGTEAAQGFEIVELLRTLDAIDANLAAARQQVEELRARLNALPEGSR